MRYLSLCSGIEAASVAWKPLGWQPVAFAEIEAFPSAVLKHHYPDVPNYGDITKFKEWPDHAVDVVCGGTPCQSFSVAGLRKGLADPRGNLSLTFLAIVDKYKPAYVIWENVPGVLSSGGGRDFAAFLGGLGQLGYGWCYRVLDAQYVRVDGIGRAVPQRRRRVWVVGYLGDWRRAAAVLSEPESVLGNTPPRRQTGQGIAADIVPGLTASGRGVERTGETRGQDPVIAVMSSGQANAEIREDGGSPSLTCLHEAPVIAHTLRGNGFDASEDGTGRRPPLVTHAITTRCAAVEEDGTGRGSPLVPIAFNARQDPDSWNGHSGPIDTDGGTQAVAFDTYNTDPTGQVTHTLRDGNSEGTPAVSQGYAVRRLMPIECERLQGFPDGYTDVPYRGKPAADGPRYKALGNSWAVNCARWIGRRIEMVEELAAEIEAEKLEDVA